MELIQIDKPGAGDLVRLSDELKAEFLDLWTASSDALPHFARRFTPAEHGANEKALDGLAGALLGKLRRLPPARGELAGWLEDFRPGLEDLARRALGLDDAQIAYIRRSGLLEGAAEFARMARAYDPAVSAEDIYQAGRNVMTANLIQLLLGLPVRVTGSVFAYSMLYPYTDNYLDDGAIPTTVKRSFNRRFRGWLEGERVQPENRREERILDMVGLIESEWERDCFPQVYASLLAIHASQARSLDLVGLDAHRHAAEVLEISFEKGGTSVLADGYLVAGDLSRDQARLLYGYGAYTQLMDDLEDIEQDQHEGRLTVFTEYAGPLDMRLNRLIHFGRVVFARMDGFDPRAGAALRGLLDRCLDPILSDIAGRAENRFSRAYLAQLEHHTALRFAALRRLRGRLARSRLNLDALVGVLV